MEGKIPFYHFYYHVIVNQKLSFLDLCLLPAQHNKCSYEYILMMKMCTDCIVGRWQSPHSSDNTSHAFWCTSITISLYSRERTENHFISLLHINCVFLNSFKDKNLPCKNDIESAWVFWVHYVYELYVCLMLMRAREDTRFLPLEVQKAVSQHGCWESNANHWATSPVYLSIKCQDTQKMNMCRLTTVFMYSITSDGISLCCSM